MRYPCVRACMHACKRVCQQQIYTYPILLKCCHIKPSITEKTPYSHNSKVGQLHTARLPLLLNSGWLSTWAEPLTMQPIGFRHDGFLLKTSIDEENSENAVKSTGALSSAYVVPKEDLHCSHTCTYNYMDCQGPLATHTCNHSSPFTGTIT